MQERLWQAEEWPLTCWLLLTDAIRVQNFYLLASIFLFPLRLNPKLRLWGLLRYLFLCLAELCFVSSSLFPSSCGDPQESVKGSCGRAPVSGAPWACVRCSTPFPRNWNVTTPCADISHTRWKMRRDLRRGTERYHPSTRPLAPFWCSALTNLLRKKPGVNYLMCLDPFPGLFETISVLLQWRNALLGRYWAPIYFPDRGIHYFSVWIMLLM